MSMIFYFVIKEIFKISIFPQMEIMKITQCFQSKLLHVYIYVSLDFLSSYEKLLILTQIEASILMIE
jgi:hypothetical protein